MRVTFVDLRQPVVLAAAGVGEAGALVVCSEDDVLNLEVVLRAREVTPGLRTVLRIFEEGPGRTCNRRLGLNAPFTAPPRLPVRLSFRRYCSSTWRSW